MNKVALLITKLFLILPSLALAEAQVTTIAYHSDRILMIPSVSPKKTEKLVGNVRAFTKKSFKLSGEYVGIAILENSKTKLSTASISLVPRLETCAKLKRSQRSEKINKFKRKLKSIVRDVTCMSDFEIYSSDYTPNDPLLSSQKDFTLESGRNLSAIKAWEYTVGSNDVVVGVVDTGVQHDHPDLKDNIWVNPHEIPDNGLDDDKNGYKDDVIGWDFANDDANPTGTSGHGTSVAGIVGATGNNGVGIAGINWNVKILPLKVFFDYGKGYYSFILKAMDYCIKVYDKGARIVATNNSWGSSVPAGSDGGLMSLFKNTFDQFQARNIIFVSAAGNAGENSDKAPYVPASLFHPIIFSVASVDLTGEISSFSNYGKVSIDIAAPGSQVYTTTLGSGYGYTGGTSMAAPHVSGAIALLASLTSDLSALQIKEVIMKSGTRLNTLTDKLVSGSTLNLYNMVTPYGQPRRPVLLGDYDLSGAVDGGDFMAWQRQFGMTGSGLSADGNNDGKVDHADLAIWKEEMAKLIPPLRGDYDRNGSVDGGDFLAWQRQVGLTGGALTADGNADGKVDGTDLQIWKDEMAKLTPPIRGDYDGNSIVDGGDFLAWQRQFGLTGNNLSADGNKDGRVDEQDLQIWKDEVSRFSQSVLAGDFDFSGAVDGADFLIWQRQNGLEGCGNSADANLDCMVDGKDLEIWKSAM